MNIYFLCFIAFGFTIGLLAYHFVSRKISNRYISGLENVINLSSEFTSILEPERLYPKIVDMFLKLTNMSNGSIMLFDKTKGKLITNYSTGKILPELNLVEDVFKTGMIKTSSDNTKLYLPLNFRHKPIGVIVLYNSHFEKKQYNLKQLNLLANFAAQSIANAIFYQLAVSDSLTGLYIHQYFMQRLTYELEIAKNYNLPLSLILFDIDHFKKFNDTYGHQTGDFVLKSISELIKNSVRQTDICARYGGEEFVIILPETELQNATTIAERIRKKVAQTKFKFDNTELTVTVSIGVSEYNPRDKKLVNISTDKFLNQVDTALYQAKQLGRNRVVVG